MVECPRCERLFRGLRCSCGYEPMPVMVPHASAADVYRQDSAEEIERRRIRLEAIKNSFSFEGVKP